MSQIVLPLSFQTASIPVKDILYSVRIEVSVKLRALQQLMAYVLGDQIPITLPTGKTILLDGVPYFGYGYKPGRWYTVIHNDDNGNEIWRRERVVK